MEEAVVRRYQPSDESEVRRLSRRLSEGFAPWRDPQRVASTIEGWLDGALAATDDEDRALFVAESHGGPGGGDGAVIGFIGITAQDHYISGRDGYIGELAVDTRSEGRGVGQRLVAAAEEWAAARGCERLTLQTGAANHRARDFYERLGFDYEDVAMARAVGGC